jgi:hypothetical protein
MEVVVPLFALSSLYLINNQNKKQENEEEGFSSGNSLPNTELPTRNYPDEQMYTSNESEHTNELYGSNRFDNGGGVYTDKYFRVPSSDKPSGGPSYYSLTGESVGGEYFQHNNMVPFFGSNVRSNVQHANLAENILDNYTGAGSQTISKKEQSPLFSPHESLQWAHGAPNQSDFIQSRVNPSMKMSNVNPFKQENVGPGLGLGYTTEGAGGFNSGMAQRDAWMPKSVDQLRVDNNPKSSGRSLLGHEGPANSAIKTIATREQMGILEKNRPERSFEFDQRNVNEHTEGFANRDIGRLFTTGGIEKGQTMRSVPVERYVSRPETAVEYSGVAGYQNEASYVPGEYMPSHNQQLGQFQLGAANAHGRSQATESDYGIKSNMAYPNNRSANKQDSYFGMVSGGIGAAVAPLLDIFRPSRKENVIGTLRPYQNPGTTVPQSYIFNPEDKLPTTTRETTENSKFHLNVNANQNGGAYSVTGHHAPKTHKQETGDFYYAGVASAGDRSRQMTSYAAEYNQRNNDIKSSTIEGRLVKGNMSLLNSDVNMRQKSRDDFLKNSRPLTGNMPYKTPDVNTMGRVAGNERALYSNIQMDRTSPEIMTSLQSNPYVTDHRKGL